MKSWNVWLISPPSAHAAGYAADARRLVSSVHAFAQSSIGTWFVVSWESCWRCAFSRMCCNAGTEDRTSPGIAGEPRVEFSVQQPGAAGSRLGHSVGNAVSHHLGYVSRQQSHGGAPFYNRVAFRSASFCCCCWRGTLLPWGQRRSKHTAEFCAAGDCAVATVSVPGSGVNPWANANFRSSFLCGSGICRIAAVMTAILSEFCAGRVISRQTGRNICGTWLLTRRNRGATADTLCTSASDRGGGSGGPLRSPQRGEQLGLP